MNLIDRFIGWFSPKAAFERARYRYAQSVISEQRAYEAAGRGRRTKDWKANGTSASQELAGALSTLRNRSRDLARNNSYAKRAIQGIKNSVVGTGIRPNVLVESAQSEKLTKALFKKWVKAKACDFDGRLGFYGLQKMIMQAVAESGECLILQKRVNDPKLPIPLQLQVIEGDYLDHTRDIERTEDGGFIRFGIQFNAQGKRTGYWLYDKHPGDGFGGYLSKFVPESEVIHVYEVLRPGQVRGVPFGAPAMLRIRDLDSYEDAQLVRQKIAACFTVFVQKPDLNGLTATDEERMAHIEPGIIEYLTPGETVAFANPPSTEGYQEYTKRVLQGIAAGYGVTYEMLTNDLSNVNFSSGRIGWIEFSRNVLDWQENIMIPALDTIWQWFMDAAFLTGKLPKTYDCDWTVPRREMLDPVKETNALNMQVRNGFKTWSEAVTEMGYDPDEVAEDIAKDYARFDALGLKLECDLRNDLAAKQPPPDPNDP